MRQSSQAITQDDSQSASQPDHTDRDYFPLILGWFLVLQTLFDNYTLITSPELSVAGVSMVTIFRYVGVIALAGYVFVTQGRRVSLKLIIPLLLIVIVYTVLHLMVRDHISLPPVIDHYSTSAEISYIIRIVMPIVLLITVARSNVDIHDVARTLSIILLLAGGMIVITSLLKISLGSYTNERVEISILEWFISGGTSYSAVAAKGYFYFANQAAALMTLCMPFALLALIRSRSKIATFAVIVGSLGMVTLGTRAALLGALLTLAVGFIFVLYEMAITKRGSWKPGALILLLLLALIALAPSSPALDRLNIARSTSEIAEHQRANHSPGSAPVPSPGVSTKAATPAIVGSSDSKSDRGAMSLSEHVTKPLSPEQITAFEKGEVVDLERSETIAIDELRALLTRTKLNEHFYTESYPAELDPAFWVTAARLPADRQLDYRFIERAMLSRITSSQETQASVEVLGLGASRQEGIFNIEQDVIKQYYAVGWMGLLLFFTWLIIPLLSLITNVLRGHFRKEAMIELLTPVITTILVIAIAIQSGNVLDALLISLPSAAIVGSSLSGSHTTTKQPRSFVRFSTE